MQLDEWVDCIFCVQEMAAAKRAAEAPPPPPPPAPRTAPPQEQAAYNIGNRQEKANAYLDVAIESASGEQVTRSYRLNKGTTTIGGVAGNNIVINDPSVSRRHAEILHKGTFFELWDCSTNGTFLNGSKVDGHAALGPGDVIQIGRARFTFRS